MNPSESTAARPLVVLDTNAALDWLVFKDSGMAALGAAIESCRIAWAATPRMREELLRALAYPSLTKWRPDRERTLTLFDRWSIPHPEPKGSRHGPLLCSDPNDQVFIDLAVTLQARWLVTHDRALHRLKRQAARQGVQVLRPREWLA